MELVRVRLLDVPENVDRPFDYYVPAELSGTVGVGSVVIVPFSGGNRPRRAVVVSAVTDGDRSGAKPVLSVAEDRFSLTDKMLGLALFLSEYTLCTFGEAVKTMIPSAAFTKTEEFLTTAPGVPVPEKLTDAAERLFAAAARGRISRTAAEKAVGREAVGALIKSGALVKDWSVSAPSNHKTQRVCSLCGAGMPTQGQKPLSAKQQAVFGYLSEHGETEIKALCAAAGVTSAVVDALAKKRLVHESLRELSRNPYADIKPDKNKKNILSPVQEEAYSRLCALYEKGKPAAALLFGVTGSGKTRVMKSMIDRVTADGRQVIVLVPEISLTPQTVMLFCSFYGERVAVLHSSLSAGERFDAYKRIRAGSVDVVIGTRSAVFAPLPSLGMIIIDEEQEHTYKSESDPKYHARDVARYRCKAENALMLLASATPSVESFYRAEKGDYTLVELPVRYGGAVLPEVSVCDMREEMRAGNVSPLSRELAERLRTVISAGEQAIIFLNRRGYNNFLTCGNCGSPVVCPHCSVSLTYHKEKQGGSLRCHYCGYRTSPPEKCPVCGSDKLKYMGCGTQKAEEAVMLAVPGARCLRMDADTTETKDAYDRILSDFREHRADVLIGTQMVTKGHDFPDVTLVGVLLADSSLWLDDFRACERTFSLITQVVGRAGRARKPGCAVIQTFSPDNEALRLSCRGDYRAFYTSEIKQRESFLWPPFCSIARISFTDSDQAQLMAAAQQVRESFKALAGGEYADLPFVAFGPFEAPVYKVRESFRMMMVIKCRNCPRTRELFGKLCSVKGSGKRGKTLISVDFDPSTI